MRKGHITFTSNSFAHRPLICVLTTKKSMSITFKYHTWHIEENSLCLRDCVKSEGLPIYLKYLFFVGFHSQFAKFGSIPIFFFGCFCCCTIKLFCTNRLSFYL